MKSTQCLSACVALLLVLGSTTLRAQQVGGSVAEQGDVSVFLPRTNGHLPSTPYAWRDIQGALVNEREWVMIPDITHGTDTLLQHLNGSGLEARDFPGLTVGITDFETEFYFLCSPVDLHSTHGEVLYRVQYVKRTPGNTFIIHEDTISRERYEHFTSAATHVDRYGPGQLPLSERLSHWPDVRVMNYVRVSSTINLDWLKEPGSSLEVRLLADSPIPIFVRALRIRPATGGAGH